MFDHPHLGDVYLRNTDGGDNASKSNLNQVVQRWESLGFECPVLNIKRRQH